MKAYRIVITSWTASFRCPNIISGVQPSLECPPLSTIYGLLSSCLGIPITPTDCGFAYCFRHTSRTFDLETILKVELDKKKGIPTKKGTSDIVRREILFDNVLTLYIKDEKLANSFFSPFFPLLLGRSGDLASVISIDSVEIEPKKGLNLLGSVFPMKMGNASGQIQALPTHFTDSVPRLNSNTQPFYILGSKGKWTVNNPDYLDYSIWKWDKDKVFIDAEGFHDPQTGLDLWWFGDK